MRCMAWMLPAVLLFAGCGGQESPSPSAEPAAPAAPAAPALEAAASESVAPEASPSEVVASSADVSVDIPVSDTAHWPNWRGPLGTGANPDANPPTTWSETENIKWKVPIPGTGQSTPVIWGDKIFLLTASEAGGGEWAFNVLCLSRADGSVVWQQEATRQVPPEGHHPTATFAPYSAVTDGAYVWACFGSRGMYCYDMNGALQWSTPLPSMEIKRSFGEGSSPLVVENAIIVLQDHEGPSRIAAYDKMTGDLIWEKSRDEGTTWSTPMAATVNGQTQVVVNATNRIRSYDLANGEVIWECGGMTDNVIPTPIFANNMVYCASGFRGYNLSAIKLGYTGDLTGSDAVAWMVEEGTPYVSSPVLYNDRLYFVDSRKASLSCVDAISGEVKYQDEDLGDRDDIYASVMGAGGHIFVAGRSGTVTVLSQSDTFEVVSTNTLDDGFNATPVALGNELYLRGDSNLYCIAGS